MTNSIDEIEFAEVILVTGSNTTEMHPIIGSKVKRAVRLHGARLIVIDPRQIPLVFYAEKWLRNFPGTDIAWINGFLNVIISEGLCNEEFIEERTEGFDEMREVVSKYTPDVVERITGIPSKDLIEAARIYASAKTATILYAMGITQHSTGTDNVKSLANLVMACGQVGRPSTGLNPLRGQNNVQGACDMGCLPNVFSGYQPVTDEGARRKMQEAWGVLSLPKDIGLTVVEIINAAEEGQIKGLYIVGENPMLSDPEIDHVEKALKKIDFLVVQDIFLTETGRLADVVLPGVSFAEKDGTFTNTERRVQRVRKAIEPVGNSRPDWEIICEISSRMGYPMRYDHPSQIMEEIARVTPSYGGINYRRLEQGGIQWPCPTIDHPGTQYLHKDSFTRGKGLFHAIEYRSPVELPDREYPFYLSTGRVLYHYHTGTMTRRSKGLVERYPEMAVEISYEDAEDYSISSGDEIIIRSRRGAIRAKAWVTERAVKGTIFIPFHFAEAAANRLTFSSNLDPISKIPAYKICAVQIEKA
jgi:formate dehydrogenase alpha subunit